MSFKSVLIWIGNNNNIIVSLEKVVSAIATMPKGAWDGVGGGGGELTPEAVSTI